MKKILLLFFVFSIYSQNFAISTRTVLEKELKEKNGIVYYSNEKEGFSGRVISKKDRTYYLNGKPHGKWLTFYPNGNLKSIENWKNGKLNGKYVLYQENGLKIFETTYFNGKDDGLYLLFHKNGKLQVQGRFKKGIPRGLWKYYNNKGKLIGKAEYPE